jgi:hypothetical protein
MVIVDSGFSFINLPFDQLKKAERAWKLESLGHFWTIDCNAKVTLGIDIGGKKYEMNEKHLILQVSSLRVFVHGGRKVSASTCTNS